MLSLVKIVVILGTIIYNRISICTEIKNKYDFTKIITINSNQL